MSSPYLSDHSLPSSSRSPSPSTAPSTPADAPVTHIIVAHSASATFLESLPIRKASNDRILHCAGVGCLKDVLELASQSLDSEFASADKWESVKAQDEASEIIYWRTKSDVSGFASTDLLDVNAQINTPTVCSSPFASAVTKASGQLSEQSALNLYTSANLRSILSLSTSKLALRLLERPPFTFPLLSQTPTTALNINANPYTIPSAAEFRTLWSAWDLVTLGMIPPSMLHQKPIDLRHKPLFYIGHLPTFNSILLTRLLRLPLIEPKSFATIFERGIDPHVDDPDHCHNHSVVPEKDEDWPHLGQVLAFRDRVRDLVLKTLDEMENGERALTRRMARTMVMMHEHEGFHIEVSNIFRHDLLHL